MLIIESCLVQAEASLRQTKQTEKKKQRKNFFSVAQTGVHLCTT